MQNYKDFGILFLPKTKIFVICMKITEDTIISGKISLSGYPYGFWDGIKDWDYKKSHVLHQ